MDNDALITQLQELARTKAAPPPLSASDLAEVEAALGITLNGSLRRIYLEVSNGGIFGLFGIRTSTAAVEEDSSLTDVRERLFNPNETAVLGRAVPVVDLGCAQWVWVDADGAVLSMVGGALYGAPVTFAEWLEASLAGRGFEVLFAPGPSRYGRNPFTGGAVEFKTTIPRGEKIWQHDGTD